MKIKSIRRFTFNHKPLHFGEIAASNSEYLSIQSQFDENGNMTEEIKYFPDENPEEINRFSYNSDNKLTVHVMEMVADDMKDVIRFERDDKGRLIKEQKYYGDDPGEATAYLYNEKGDVNEILKTDADGEFESREIFEYNDKGHIIRRSAVDATGKTVEKSDMVYDEKENLLNRKDVDAAGNLLLQTDYSYNEKNALVSMQQRNAAGKLVESVMYVYDHRGNVIEKAIRDFHPRTFKYSFDEHSHCVEEIMYDQHGQLNSKSSYEYDENGNLVREINYNTDVNRQELNKGHRYEYEFYV